MLFLARNPLNHETDAEDKAAANADDSPKIIRLGQQLGHEAVGGNRQERSGVEEEDVAHRLRFLREFRSESNKRSRLPLTLLSCAGLTR